MCTWIWDGIKSLFRWDAIKRDDVLFVAFKRHKQAKKNIKTFWEDLEEENPDLYDIFYKDYDHCNKLLQKRDKKYPKIKLVKTWWYNKDKGIHWSWTKEIEIWDD